MATVFGKFDLIAYKTERGYGKDCALPTGSTYGKHSHSDDKSNSFGDRQSRSSLDDTVKLLIITQNISELSFHGKFFRPME